MHLSNGSMLRKWRACCAAGHCMAMQEYDFKIIYRKGTQNTNADALSWRDHITEEAHVTVTTGHAVQGIRRPILKAQQQDPVLKIALQSSSSNSSCPITWQQPQLCRYRPCSYSYEMVQCTGVYMHPWAYH